MFSLSLIIVILSHCILAKESLNSTHPLPIQILFSVNQNVQLEVNEFRKFLEADEIKDRNIVVVAISDSFRKGKSFLLNFYLRYLYAQYKNHDVYDWICEYTECNEIRGLSRRGGQSPKTHGILMWPDVFTHDYKNGEKIAIILLDTQVPYDSTSSDFTRIFALSTLVSSVQCHNLMQTIQEDDLQHLQLFNEYGRLTLEQSNKKPLQHLIFILRFWPYEFETAYSWYKYNSNLLDEILDVADLPPEMRQIRKQIKSSFEEISAFVLPYPGSNVAEAQHFDANLQDISLELKNYLKTLVPTLLAPENLIVKQINGRKLRARDLVHYFEAYVTAFNGNTLPEPKAILMATIKTNNLVLVKECLDLYCYSMEILLRQVDSYSQTELMDLHEKAKKVAIDKFQTESNFGGGNELSLSFQSILDFDIEEKFEEFDQQNVMKRIASLDKFSVQQAKEEAREQWKLTIAVAASLIGGVIGNIMIGPLGVALGTTVGAAIGGLILEW